MMGIVEFLEARIAEDEAVAKVEVDIIAATFGKVPGEFEIHYGWARHTAHVENGARGSSFAPGAPDPARVLREVAAKRELLELHYDENPGPGDIHYCGTCHDYCMHQAEDWPCETIRVVASAFSDHPDFNEEWRP